MDEHFNCVTLSSSGSDDNEKTSKRIHYVDRIAHNESELRNQKENDVNKKKDDVVTQKKDENSKHKPKTINNTIVGLCINKVGKVSEVNKAEFRRRIQPCLLTNKEDEQVDVKKKLNTFLQICHEKCKSYSVMAKVQEKLLKTYANADPEYIRSVQFQNILSKETKAVTTSDREPWCNIKTIMDELKSNKVQVNKKCKLEGNFKEEPKPSTSRTAENLETCGDDDEKDYEDSKIKDPKTRKHLKKLEKAMRLLNKRIRYLEEKEVNWSDDEDSGYIKLDRYRAHICKVYRKICEIRGKQADAERPYLRKVSFSGSSYPEINYVIEKFYNKNREFPDFHDIKKLVQQVSKKKNINLTPIKIHQVAAAAFKEFGEQLKRLRQYDDYNILCSYLDDHADPAADNPDLEEELKSNMELGKKRLQSIIDEYADKACNDMLLASDSESERHSVEEGNKHSEKEDNQSSDEEYNQHRETKDNQSSDEEDNKRYISLTSYKSAYSSEDEETVDNENNYVTRSSFQEDSTRRSNKNIKRKTCDDYEEEEQEDNEKMSLSKFTSSLQLVPRKTKRMLNNNDKDEQNPPVIKKPKLYKVNTDTDSPVDNTDHSDKNELSSKSDSETNLESDVSETKSKKHEHHMSVSENYLSDKSSPGTDISRNENIEEVVSVDKRKQGCSSLYVDRTAGNKISIVNNKRNNIIQNNPKQGCNLLYVNRTLRNDTSIISNQRSNILQKNPTTISLQEHYGVTAGHNDSVKADVSDIKYITVENSPERKDSDSDEIDVIAEIPRKTHDKPNTSVLKRKAETADICIVHETKNVVQSTTKKSWISKRIQKGDQLKYAVSSGRNNSMQQTQTKSLPPRYFPNGSTKFITNTSVQSVLRSETTKVITKGVNPSTKSDVKEIIILD